MLENMWLRLGATIYRVRTREEGQTLVEYALIIALVSVASIAALGLLSDSIDGVFGEIQSALNGALS